MNEQSNVRKSMLAERGLRPNDIVKHFKGGKYQIIGTAQHTETRESMVLYRAIGAHAEKIGTQIWARPEDMFCSEVDRQKYPHAEQRYRFEKCAEETGPKPEHWEYCIHLHPSCLCTRCKNDNDECCSDHASMGCPKENCPYFVAEDEQ